ncbi:MAG: hypothetical protein JSV31_18195 [Desulfobacterales bacterium]|nr:MAG: hypothetical protein JSV31_18195 [Desulfobacterales bacterium]
MRPPKSLISLIRQQTSRPVPPGVHALCDEILARHPSATQAILFYGSCFRKGDASEGLVDLYVLVDRYRCAYRKRLHAIFNKLLPPNVYYQQVVYNGRILRAKYTVISLADFQRGTSTRWFHSYLWGRFAQPTGILYASNEQIAETVQTSLAQAVLTFMTRTLPRVPTQFEARDLWQQGLLLSYRSELRAERTDKLLRLVDAASPYYEQLTQTAMEVIPYHIDAHSADALIRYDAHIPSRIRFISRLAWRVRFVQGKMLSLLRLFKALFTFKGGIDYVLWKIERHSGITLEVAPRLRRYPLVGVCVIFWRLYRRGAFR